VLNTFVLKIYKKKMQMQKSTVHIVAGPKVCGKTHFAAANFPNLLTFDPFVPSQYNQINSDLQNGNDVVLIIQANTELNLSHPLVLIEWRQRHNVFVYVWDGFQFNQEQIA
jgi:hypothetical protein